MTKVDKLAHEISSLSRDELAAFREWFREYDAEEWDRQIKEDCRAGKLDGLAEQAISDHRSGRTGEI